jgi:tRNA 5-methylaminomethyl-2-thiouridine biosynthesis bifunctional protein
MYDIAIIGAGINGCSVAYEFLQEGKSVLLLDKEAVAAGGSGAAGAFISPKFSKGGELKELLNAAFNYSLPYYKNNFPDAFTPSQLLHIAKDAKDDAMLHAYKQNAALQLEEVPQKLLASLTPEAGEREHISLNAAIVNAHKVCHLMSEGAAFRKEKVVNLYYNDDFWVINETYSAKEIVLALGAYENVIEEPYLDIRGIWGHRIDVQTPTTNPCSLHQFVSISKSSDGKVAIGATHNIHYHPEKTEKPYDIQKGREELLQKAAKTIKLDDIKILKDYTGLRSGSVDYMPLLGPLIMSQETIANCGKRLQDKRISYDAFSYYPHLSIINGSGGYGFVLAPYLAKILKEYILQNRTIDKSIAPARYFARWARRR